MRGEYRQRRGRDDAAGREIAVQEVRTGARRYVAQQIELAWECFVLTKARHR